MSKVLVFTAYDGPETQEFVEQPTPVPGPDEITIEVKAAGVNPVDWKNRAGQLGSRWQLPAPMGREASGVVTAVGTGVENFAVGDEVLGLAAEGQGTDSYSLDRAAEAVALVEAVHTAGKVAVEP